MSEPRDRASVERALGRYRDIIDDWQGFCDALLRPHVHCLWAHPLRPASARLREILAADGLDTTPIPWSPGAYRLAQRRHPGRHPSYLAGLYQVQEEASLMPARLLAPEPGERVLDLCAAPGNKSAQLALAMRNRGTVVANDRDVQRARAIQNLIDRLGLLNISVTTLNGVSYPLAAGPFDRVLVDAPCSAEGTARKQATVRAVEPGFRRWVTGVQRQLLERAVALTRPGGRIVYSTCTFAPEENELIVDALLSDYGHAVRLLPATIANLRARPGLTSWQGRALRPELARTLRLWPHVSDTGGFFAAVFERTQAALAPPDRPPRPPQRGWRPALDEPKVRAVCERHGLPEALFEDLHAACRGRYVRLRTSDHDPPRGVAVCSSGLPAIAKKPRQPRLSTYGALAFGHAATRATVALQPGEVAQFHDRAEIPLGLDRLADGADRAGGYLIARLGADMPLGLGLLRVDRDRAWLESRYPKAWSQRTADAAAAPPPTPSTPPTPPARNQRGQT